MRWNERKNIFTGTMDSNCAVIVPFQQFFSKFHGADFYYYYRHFFWQSALWRNGPTYLEFYEHHLNTMVLDLTGCLDSELL